MTDERRAKVRDQVAEHRRRRREAGLVPVQTVVWVKPEHKTTIRELLNRVAETAGKMNEGDGK